ncbi:chaperone for protein-folding within the ER, fungal-domain-containing protein [Aspergillus caelatus]|uniref:Protein ROT1 n=2 Tax=Aspergillus subgen. Circumdati TaxID=2720871 RepID=A0A5N6ZU23_9EURO|nr:chaperone for protein-folding within the ER, fungal-domain-containing protein [Aspergillus caelatus]KAE8359750.1 chaperone for protein-folding within the ER, fungal-domain-containing protein [Aspergillus caelatus]KAE8422031.1 chaperone for protein-folding within the ER, fungal-domain-containing protein [Aspergillus pseudocaelatus]
MLAGYLSLSLLATAVSAASISDLVGTWSTKSRKVVTGPDFYDPINDKFLEPDLTGISYSFTDDGHYEEAYYRAMLRLSNMSGLCIAVNPSCPKGIMQWQHGKFVLNSDGSLQLTPIASDGRQLVSDPCSSSLATYTRYNQTETFNVSKDPYHGIQRLDLKSFDDSPMHPMYLVYQPPQMLPTTTLNPVSETGKNKRHVARDTDRSPGVRNLITKEELTNPDRWLWVGVFATALGGITLFYS